MKHKITAIILAGGKSSRIGTEKALLKLNNVTIIESIYNLVTEIFDEVIIISDEKEKYSFLTDNVYKDIYPGLGPLSGIHSGLKNSNTEFNFIISCDMPFVNNEVVNFIISKISSETEIVFTKSDSSFHTLCGVYQKKSFPKLEELILNSENERSNKLGKAKIKLFDLINSVNAEIIDIENEKFYHSNLMFNMNTLEDYEFVKTQFE